MKFSPRSQSASTNSQIAFATAGDDSPCPCEILFNGESMRNRKDQIKVWVGEKIILSLKCKGNLNPKVTWAIPGKKFKDYDPKKSNSNFVPFNDDIDLNKNPLTFYWADGGGGEESNSGERVISVVYKDGEHSCKDAGTVVVMRPRVAITGEILRHVAIDPAVPNIHLGSVGNRGIEFRKRSLDPYGSYWWLQTGTANRCQRDSGEIPVWRHWSGYGLDTNFQYPDVDLNSVAYDYPEMSFAVGADMARVDDKFVIYVMFKSIKTGSKWVPISKMGWYWKGKAELIDSQWQAVAGTLADGVDQKYTDTTDHPLWSQNLADIIKPSNSQLGPCNE